MMPNTQSLHILGEDVPTIRALKKMSSANVPTAQFVLLPYSEMSKTATLDLSTRSNHYDLILQYHTALTDYIRNDYVISLTEIREKFPQHLVSGCFPFENDLFQACWKEVGWFEDKAFAIPFSANTMLMACNKELFRAESYRQEFRDKYKKELTPPQTWEEFKQIAEFFYRPHEGIYGICLQGAPYFIYYEWANLTYSLGGGIMRKTHGWQGDRTTPLILNESATIDATHLYVTLKAYDATDDFLNTDAVSQINILKKKKVALALVWSDVAYSLAYENEKPLGQYDFFPIPGKVSMLAGGSFYINRSSKNADAAIAFVLEQMNTDKQIELMKLGLCSPMRSVYETPEVQKIPYANALKTSLKRGVYMLEAGPDSESITSIMSKTLQTLMHTPQNRESITDALNHAQTEIQESRDQILKAR